MMSRARVVEWPRGSHGPALIADRDVGELPAVHERAVAYVVVTSSPWTRPTSARSGRVAVDDDRLDAAPVQRERDPEPGDPAADDDRGLRFTGHR
jgi:hypothetical protein